MRDNRDDANGGKVKRFSYASSKANKESSEDWDFIKPKKQNDGLGGLGNLSDLNDVWSIRKNVSLGNGPKTSNTSSMPAPNSLTANTGFYSRHGQMKDSGRGYTTSIHGQNMSPTGSPSGFQGTTGYSWNQPRAGGGGYSYSNQEHNSSPSFSDSPSPRGGQTLGRTAGPSGGLQVPGRTATHGNSRNMQMGGVYPRSPKPDRHSPNTQHNSKGRPSNNNWPNF